MTAAGRERLFDLLADRATEGLAGPEGVEVDRLLEHHDSDVDVDEIDRIVAVMEEVFAPVADEPLPDRLRERIRADLTTTSDRRSGPVSNSSTTPARADKPEGVSWLAPSMWGWYVAAAALLLAFTLWSDRREDTVARSPEQRRADLVALGGDIVRVEWETSSDPEFAAVTGDVVWSTERQEGYMRFSGMPVNQREEAQYQLWIVDPGRDKEPVDGGVFDVSSSGEIVIPIDAALSVVQPRQFVITREIPGGVVVSEGPFRVTSRSV